MKKNLFVCFFGDVSVLKFKDISFLFFSLQSRQKWLNISIIKFCEIRTQIMYEGLKVKWILKKQKKIRTYLNWLMNSVWGGKDGFLCAHPSQVAKGAEAAKSHFCEGIHSNQFTESLLRIYSISYSE